MWPFGSNDKRNPEKSRDAATITEANGTQDPDVAQRERWSLTLLLVLVLLATAVVGFLAPLWDAYSLLVARQDAFSFAAMAGGVIAAALLVVIAIREVRSIMRLRRINRLRLLAGGLQLRAGQLDKAARAKDAARLLRGVIGLYRSRKPAGVDIGPLLELRKAKIETADTVLAAIEGSALRPLDREALLIVRRASLRVGAFTAASPWGAFDMLIVAFKNLMMVRAILQHYGGRPGLVATLRMTLGYAAGIGVAGAMGAVTSAFADQARNRIGAYLLGGLAKGTANATSTALLGLFAVCAVRPIPFEPKQAPGIIDLVFPADGFVARTIERAGQLKETAVGTVQALLPNGGGQGAPVGR